MFRRSKQVFHCSKFLLSIDHGLDTVVHVLNEVLLGAAESTSVGDIEDAVAGVRVLTSATTDLDIVLSGNSFEFLHLLTELGKMDMDGGSKSGSEVGGARGDITQVVVVGEAGLLLDSLSGSGESLEDGSDVSTLLHGDDTELILLINPDEEGLGVIVEDTSALGPVAVETAGIKETIALPRIKRAKSVKLLI